MTEIKAQSSGFTPVIDAIVQDLDLMSAVVFGVIWRYCQMSNRVCTASQATIAERCGISPRSAIRKINLLIEAGYIEDIGSTKISTKTYKDTGKARIGMSISAGVTESHTPMTERQTPYATESYPLMPQSHTKIEKKRNNTREDKDISPILEKWKSLLPDKPQPRPSTKSIQAKIKSRMRDRNFEHNWEEAMVKASINSGLQKEGWFTLEYFLRNDTNYEKILNGVFDWMHNGKTSSSLPVDEDQIQEQRRQATLAEINSYGR